MVTERPREEEVPPGGEAAGTDVYHAEKEVTVLLHLLCCFQSARTGQMPSGDATGRREILTLSVQQ